MQSNSSSLLSQNKTDSDGLCLVLHNAVQDRGSNKCLFVNNFFVWVYFTLKNNIEEKEDKGLQIWVKQLWGGEKECSPWAQPVEDNAYES